MLLDVAKAKVPSRWVITLGYTTLSRVNVCLAEQTHDKTGPWVHRLVGEQRP